MVKWKQPVLSCNGAGIWSEDLNNVKYEQSWKHLVQSKANDQEVVSKRNKRFV